MATHKLELAGERFQKFYDEVVSSGTCSACGACVVVCPLRALDYVDEVPVLVAKCTDCGVCWKACPRFNPSLDDLERSVFKRTRRDDEEFGIHEKIFAARSRDERVLKVSQDGGLVTSLLIWALEKRIIDGALVSGLEAKPWIPKPLLATSVEDLLRASGSRYTYSPNLLAAKGAVKDFKKLAYVGVPCQILAIRQMQLNRLRRYSDPIFLTIGLMCSEAFTYEGLMEGMIGKGLGVRLEDVAKVNIKGKVLVYLKSGEVKSIPLKEAKMYARENCSYCGDFSAELADISAGGIGASGWTITVARSKRGVEVLEEAIRDGVIEANSIENFKGSLAILVKLAKAQRERPALHY